VTLELDHPARLRPLEERAVERLVAQLLDGLRRAGEVPDDPRGQTEKAYA